MRRGIKLYQLVYRSDRFAKPFYFLFDFYLFFFPFLLREKRSVIILSGYVPSMGNNIYIVVVQGETTHNKILPWQVTYCVAHLLYHLFFILEILFMLYLGFVDSFHIMVKEFK